MGDLTFANPLRTEFQEIHYSKKKQKCFYNEKSGSKYQIKFVP